MIEAEQMTQPAQVNSLMTRDELGQYILRTLGAPKVGLEFTMDHVEDSIEDAIRWFSAKKGLKASTTIPYSANVTEYQLPDDVNTVLYIAFTVPSFDLSIIFSPYILQDEKVPYDVFAAPQAAGIYSSFAQSLQYISMAKRLLNSELDWRQENRLLYIFPPPREGGTMLLDYTTNAPTIEQLPERDHYLVKRYSLAQAKIRLGRIRSKYTNGMPGAQGPVMMDGAALLAEGMAEIERLDQELALSSFPMGFMKG